MMIPTHPIYLSLRVLSGLMSEGYAHKQCAMCECNTTPTSDLTSDLYHERDPTTTCEQCGIGLTHGQQLHGGISKVINVCVCVCVCVSIQYVVVTLNFDLL